MGIRISEMEEATTFGADDYVPIVTNGTNKKALGAKIKDFIAGFFVSKSGDTMTGDLNINVTNAKTKYINPNMTLDTSANNGLSSDSGYGAYFTDKNGNAVGDISMTTRSTGANYVQLMARNKKTDGTAVANYIDVIAAKDGSSSYYVSNPAEFRHAIGLNVTQTTTGTNGGVLRKCGNVVQLKFDNALVTNRGSITSDYRPSARILTNCVLKKISTNKWYAGMISIDTTGGFTIYYMNATDGNITDITTNSDWSISVSVTYIN